MQVNVIIFDVHVILIMGIQLVGKTVKMKSFTSCYELQYGIVTKLDNWGEKVKKITLFKIKFYFDIVDA